MAVPSVATYSAAALIAAHTALRDLIDTGSGAGSIKIRTSADALLATVPLSDPCGTVHGTTGVFTLSVASSPAASVTGDAAYAEVCDVAGAVVLALPAQAGESPVSGKIVLTSLTLTSGVAVQINSAIIG